MTFSHDSSHDRHALKTLRQQKGTSGGLSKTARGGAIYAHQSELLVAKEEDPMIMGFVPRVTPVHQAIDEWSDPTCVNLAPLVIGDALIRQFLLCRQRDRVADLDANRQTCQSPFPFFEKRDP